MTYPNVRGQQGTLEALRASNPGRVLRGSTRMLNDAAANAEVSGRVLRGLIGPDGGQVEGMQDAPGAGPGAAIDGAIADHEQRISALEAAGGDAA